MRFFHRAIDIYDEGLKKFPRSLDLAYNKARVLYEIATNPLTIKQLQTPLIDALEIALTAHQYASELDPDYPDTLFNTAQVLTSIAEELTSIPGRITSSHDNRKAVEYLKEALEAQSRCLAIQEQNFTEQTALKKQLVNSSVGSQTTSVQQSSPLNCSQPIASSGSPACDEGEWVEVIEPVTADTLIDTVIAQLATLATLCGIIPDIEFYDYDRDAVLLTTETLAATLLLTKLPAYVSYFTSPPQPERQSEVNIAKANFSSAFLEASYRVMKIDAKAYKQERNSAFAFISTAQPPIEELLADLDSLGSYVAALTDSQIPTQNAPYDVPKDGPPLWGALNSILQRLTQISQHQSVSSNPSANPSPSPLTQADIHYQRGDISVQLRSLGDPPYLFPQARENAFQLLQNAQTFYKNAAKLYSIQPPIPHDEATTHKLRASLVRAAIAVRMSFSNPTAELYENVRTILLEGPYLAGVRHLVEAQRLDPAAWEELARDHAEQMSFDGIWVCCDMALLREQAYARQVQAEAGSG